MWRKSKGPAFMPALYHTMTATAVASAVAFGVRRRRFAFAFEVFPEESVRVIGHRNHILPAVSAGEDVELVRDAELRQALVELLVRLREAIVVLIANVEVDL